MLPSLASEDRHRWLNISVEVIQVVIAILGIYRLVEPKSYWNSKLPRRVVGIYREQPLYSHLVGVRFVAPVIVIPICLVDVMLSFKSLHN